MAKIVFMFRKQILLKATSPFKKVVVVSACLCTNCLRPDIQPQINTLEEKAVNVNWVKSPDLSQLQVLYDDAVNEMMI